MKLILGDCLEKLKDMEDNSVDSIVTDPPYGISFMSKKWDYDVPKVEVWKEVLRVLKPGGHMLCACGTRTQHRMAVNIEDAGFEIRDIVAWIYGCLSEDTEILTINGWERYNKDIVNNLVLCYDVNEDKFSFNKPVKDYFYENKHTAYRIKSDKTDQIVSRNHRVLVERCGRKVFVEAEALERQENIPILESLSDLPETIYDEYKRTSNEEQGLSEMYKEKKGEVEHREKTGKDRVSNLQENVLSDRTEQKQSEKILLNELCRKSEGLVKTLFSKWKRKEKTRNRIEWRKKPSLERWSNLFQEERKLWKIQNKICSLSERIFSNVKERRLCYGTSFISGTGIGKIFNFKRSDTSQRPQSRKQLFRKPNVIQEQQGTQNIRSTRATIKPIEHKGNVWCVQVPTGAFVARRNGKMFITGNSGFPKSHNIGKALDGLLGKQGKGFVSAGDDGRKAEFKQDLSKRSDYGYKFKPKSDNAKKFEGWGTALKPAMELWTLCRKPLSEKTVASNCLKWGTGGINIDECRVEADENYLNGSFNPEKKQNGDVYNWSNGVKDIRRPPNTQGRFPANLIHDGSEEVVSGFPDSKSTGGSGKASQKTAPNSIYGEYKDNYISQHLGGLGDSGSASRFFYCAKSSKSERNKGLEGFEETTVNDGGKKDIDNAFQRGITKRVNSHPTVKPVKLMQYLCRLITPKEGIILDPFMGSGTTGIGAKLEGFDFIGIEMNEEYMEIAKARIDGWEVEQQLEL